MNKHVSVMLVAVAVFITVFAAGCTSQTASPTASPTASQSATQSAETTATTAKIASYMQSKGYAVVRPFTKVTQQFSGHDMYIGAVTGKLQNDTREVKVRNVTTRPIGTAVTVVVGKSPTDASAVYNNVISSYKAEGYSAAQTDGGKTTLQNPQGQKIEITQDVPDNFVMYSLA